MKLRLRKSALYMLFAVIAVSASSSAMSARLKGFSYDYYDNAGNLVGGATFTCRGPVERWGIETVNADFMEWPCSPYDYELDERRP